MKKQFFKLGLSIRKGGKRMKAKDKTKGVQKQHRKNGLKNTGIFLAFIIILLGILIIYNQYFAKNN